MSDEKYEFSDPEISRGLIDSAYETQDTGARLAPGLRYSSPWPWVSAIMISLLLWAGIAAAIWKLF
jgi:hypothetical protein